MLVTRSFYKSVLFICRLNTYSKFNKIEVSLIKIRIFLPDKIRENGNVEKDTSYEIKWIIDFTFEISFFYTRYAILLHF